MKCCIPCIFGAQAERGQRLASEPGLAPRLVERQAEIERMERKFDLDVIDVFGPIMSMGSDIVRAIPDPSKSYGVWEGWGTSLCWWANIFGDRDDLADLCFTGKTTHICGQSLPGLQMNIARYCLGACSFEKVGKEQMVVSKNIPPFKQIQGFWVNPATDDPGSNCWDWSVDANQTLMASKAIHRGVNYLELFSNSPMWWMTRNNNPSGSGRTDNIMPNQYEPFCKYIAITLERFKQDQGISFTSVSPFNEPSSNWWNPQGGQEGCHVSTNAQRLILAVLAKELDKRHLRDVELTASDETSYDEAISTFDKLTADSDVKKTLQKVNVHGYQHLGGRRDKLYSKVSQAGKKLWNSEFGCGDGSGMKMAACIICDFAQLHPTAWIYWQMVDEADGWGMLKANCRAETPVIQNVNNKHYVLAQFSRHIRPGMTIIDSGDKHMVAAYDASTRRLVYVVVNIGEATNVTFDLTYFGAVSGPVTRWVTSTQGKGDRYKMYRDIMLAGKTFIAPVAESSVATIEIEGVTK